MKILFLGNNVAKDLSKWLISRGEDVVYTEDKVGIDYVKTIKPDFIISYNYHYMIIKEIIDYIRGKIVNLHISYLPWNKGTYPNVWSFLENTPKGVSIIWLNEMIDTGDIIVQREVSLDEEVETLRSSYEELHREIQKIFKENWAKIKEGRVERKKQKGKGSFHYDREYETLIRPLIEQKGWNISVKELKQKYALWKNKKVVTKEVENEN